MEKIEKRKATRRRRARRTRTGLREKGVTRPRLSIFRSNRHTILQLIDDVKGVTIASAHTKELSKSAGSRVEQARALGKLLAKRAREKRVSMVSFDRGRFSYHGIVKAAAEGAREGGLTF